MRRSHFTLATNATLFLVLAALVPAWSGAAPVNEVTPAQCLSSQPKPVFRPGHTLPPLTRWGWVLPLDARIELAEHWGYALEFGGYATDAVVDRALNVQVSDEARVLALAAKDPQRYPLCVILSRELPAQPPPETWTHDAAGHLLPANPPDWSPEAPRAAIEAAAELRSRPLRKIREKAPIAIVLNGGEYALGVLGFSRKYWEQDPRVLAAKGDTGWFKYISRRKGEMETAIADACRRAAPDRRLYVYYTAGGGIHRNRTAGWEDWAWGYEWMRGVSDLPSNELYYKAYNDGWTGNYDLLTEALNAKGHELKYRQPFSYDWLNGGSLDESKPPLPRAGRTTAPVADPAGKLSDPRLYAGFLKCVYTAGTVGGVAGYFNVPAGGFGHRFPADRPPHWLRQMTTLAHVHALFSFQEPFVRQSDLLPGPDKHRWSKDQPAYEFPSEPGVRILARKHSTRPEWLITAWAADGRARGVTCRIPDLGEVGLHARPEGSVYFISLAGATPRVQWQDEHVPAP